MGGQLTVLTQFRENVLYVRESLGQCGVHLLSAAEVGVYIGSVHRLVIVVYVTECEL